MAWVPALFFDGSKPRSANLRRQANRPVARWITGPQNPLFAKAVVNRVWANFFGRGFVQPIDDLDPANTPIFGDVFDEMCLQFRLHGCDLKYLVRVITCNASLPTVQSWSVPRPVTDGSTLDNFTRMPLRRMTSDQIYASFVQVNLSFANRILNCGNVVNQLLVAGGDEFQTKFADSALAPTEIETTILQALSLMEWSLCGGSDQRGTE